MVAGEWMSGAESVRKGPFSKAGRMGSLRRGGLGNEPPDHYVLRLGVDAVRSSDKAEARFRALTVDVRHWHAWIHRVTSDCDDSRARTMPA